jgi:hypothetical protein
LVLAIATMDQIIDEEKQRELLKVQCGLFGA